MIEHANHDRLAGSIEAAIQRAPEWARRRVAAARRRAGLQAIGSPAGRADSARLGVWWDPRSPHRPAGSGRAVGSRAPGPPARLTRLILVVSHGDALPGAIRASHRETIAPTAFGPAEQLNREPGWGITAPGHDGPHVAFGGRPSLRAHDTPVGLTLVWYPDLERLDHREAIAAIEGGAGCSPHFRIQARRRLELREGPIEVIRRARLIAVAITSRPAYMGAVAAVFRGSRRDDGRELREQLDLVARRARDRARITRGW